ncbi:MAG TPA: lysylphosphatidylglycerol synthase domain-containing protein [Solirubrobacterales bacterium]|nr:lysylphosphatidylglycerol synthase domain-containing protein [Solirubrobacterales bacterium]
MEERSSQRRPFLHRVGEAGARVGSRPPRRRGVRVAVQIGIVVLIFGFLVLTVVSQWDEVKAEGVEFQVLWLLPAVAVLLCFYVLGALGWDLILRFLGHRIGFVQAQVAWGQPLLARYVPGSVLYVLGRLLLSERAGVPRRTTMASLVYEQAISASAAIAVASYFFISHPDLGDQPLRWAVLLVVPAAVFVLQPRVFGPLADRVLAAFGREPLPATMPLRGVLTMLAYYALNWALAGLGVYLVARSVRDFPLADLPIVGSAQAVGYVAALLTIVAPAGLGVRDAAFAWAVKAALPNRSFAVGSLIAIVVRFVLTAVEVIYAAAVTAIARRRGWTLGFAATEEPAPAQATAEPG